MDLYLLAIICFVAMISPGPDFVIVTRNSLCYQRPQALATAFGIVAGCLVHASFSILGLALLLSQSVLLFSTVKYVGACYLVYLGIQGLRSPAPKSSGEIEAVTKSAKGPMQPSLTRAFMQGLFCNLLNPKCVLFLLSLFTQFVSVDASLVDKFTVAAVFVIEAAIYWPLLVFFLQSYYIRNFFASFRHILDRICGGLLCVLGAKVALAR